MTETRSKSSLLRSLAPYKSRIALGVALLLATNVFDKAVPWALMHAVDALRDHRFRSVATQALVALGLAAGMWVVRSWSRIQVFNIGRDVEFDLRNELLAQVHKLGPAFLREMSTGEVMSRATNDLGQVRLLVGFGVLNVVNSVFAYVGAIGLMMVISPKLTLFALAPYPLFLFVTRAFSKALYVRSQESQKALGTLSDRVQEGLAGLRVVRAFALETYQRDRFETANVDALDKNMRLVVLRGLMWPLLSLIGALGTLITIGKGGAMVLAHELTPGQFAAFTAYLGQLVWPTLALGYLLGIVQRGRASYDRVREILDAEPSISDPPHGIASTGPGALRVSGLSYEQNGRRILDGVSFAIPAGGSLAVVGAIGAGKSTLSAMLPRLLPTPPGTVFLDGVDVTSLELRSLRHAIGYAPQDPFLFSTTVERNVSLALAQPHDALETVRAATREAAILDEIDGLPEAFETVVGERGVQLSGGQKQRVALARALVGGPKILVLDDPLSAVDARTESRILEAIDRVGEGRTVVLVTHRVAAAKRMDAILVLDDGRVAETGTHDFLVAQGGIYARLAETQALEEELEQL